MNIRKLVVFIYIMMPIILFLDQLLINLFGLSTRIEQIIVMTLMYLVFLLYLKTTRLKLYKSNLTIISIAYCFWLITSTLILDFTSIVGAVFSIFQILLFFVFIPTLPFKKNNVIQLLWVFSMIGLVVAISFLLFNYHIFLMLLRGQHIYYGNIYPILGNKNTDAIIIFFGFVCVVILSRVYKTKFIKFLVILLLIALALTFSRSVYVAAFLFLLIFFGLNSNTKKKILTAVLALPLAFIFLSSEIVLENFLRVDRGLSGRDDIWLTAWNVISNNLVSGIGIGKWRSVTGLDQSAHNSYLHLLTETGLVGLILYTLMMVIILFNTYSLFRKSSSEFIKIVSSGLIAFIISMSIKLIFETILVGYFGISSVFYAMLLSLAVILYVNQKKYEGDICEAR